MLRQTLRSNYIDKLFSPGDADVRNREGDMRGGDIRDGEFSEQEGHVSRLSPPPNYLCVDPNGISYPSFTPRPTRHRQ